MSACVLAFNHASVHAEWMHAYVRVFQYVVVVCLCACVRVLVLVCVECVVYVHVHAICMLYACV